MVLVKKCIELAIISFSMHLIYLCKKAHLTKPTHVTHFGNAIQNILIFYDSNSCKAIC